MCTARRTRRLCTWWNVIGWSTTQRRKKGWTGPPYAQALQVVERYRLLEYEEAKEGLERAAKENFRLPPDTIPLLADSDPNYRGKHLQLKFTVEDEGVFTMPWSATITYGRPPMRAGGVPGGEFVCAENPRSSGRKPAVPTADKPDF